ncbi:hypothetical protein [Leptospira noguchii]|uniref:hypothetical protein n=1 Tax=Leptospira noguchii TaxID=28182 RepID=UPI00055F2525|nr:hypothetical protein [Leptospira noguchii]
MNVEIKNIIICLICILNMLSCSDVNINGYGVDTKDIVTRNEFVTNTLLSYTLKYESCRYTVDKIGFDPILFSLFLNTTGSTSLNFDLYSASFWTNSEFRAYYYKDDMDTCSRSVLSVPCQPTAEDQAKALALSFLKDCRPERASFRDKGQGNY